MHNTYGLRVLAFVGGLVFLGGTVIQVYGDVIKGAAITEKHLLSAVIIAGAILVGHLAIEGWRAGRYSAACGFAGIFLACTALVVLMSVGRQGETMAWTQAQADASEDHRRIAREGLKEANGMLAEAQRKLAKECASGKGKRCDGIRSTISVYEAAAAGRQSALDKLGPAKLVAAEEEQFAKLLATFFSVDKDRVKAGTIMAKPFFVSAVCEFGVILCFGFAFRGTRVRSRTSSDLSNVPDAELSELKTQFFGPDRPNGSDKKPLNRPNRPKPSSGGRTFCKEEVLQSLLTQLALGERFESQDAMRERFGLAKSTMSNWLAEWQDLIPARRQIGRRKALANA